MELSRRRFIPSSTCKDINQQFFSKKKNSFDHLTTQKQHCVKQKKTKQNTKTTYIKKYLKPRQQVE
jgi:hypothetical protein